MVAVGGAAEATLAAKTRQATRIRAARRAERAPRDEGTPVPPIDGFACELTCILLRCCGFSARAGRVPISPLRSPTKKIVGLLGLPPQVPGVSRSGGTQPPIRRRRSEQVAVFHDKECDRQSSRCRATRPDSRPRSEPPRLHPYSCLLRSLGRRCRGLSYGLTFTAVLAPVAVVPATVMVPEISASLPLQEPQRLTLYGTFLRFIAMLTVEGVTAWVE